MNRIEPSPGTHPGAPWQLDPEALLKYLEGGEFAAEVKERLQTVIDAVATTRNKGSLTIRLDVAPVRGQDLGVSIEPHYSERIPKPAPRGAVVYTQAGELYRQDPRQYALDVSVRSIETGRVERAAEQSEQALREEEEV